MKFEFAPSVEKHGFTNMDAANAIAHHVLHAPNFGVSRKDGVTPVSAWVGPAVGGRTIEVFGSFTANKLSIFHVMDVQTETIEKLKM